MYQKIYTRPFTIATFEYSKTGNNTNAIIIKCGKLLKIKHYTAMKENQLLHTKIWMALTDTLLSKRRQI